MLLFKKSFGVSPQEGLWTPQLPGCIVSWWDPVHAFSGEQIIFHWPPLCGLSPILGPGDK